VNRIEVCLTRAGAVESTHMVHAVVTGGGAPDLVRGDPEMPAFWRSSMKPFQALPVARHGVLSALGLGESELAIACASHHGTASHLDAAGRILDAAGATQTDLACGPHRPVDVDAARALDLAGRLPERIHNNCSGKHASMIASALAEGWEIEGYHEPAHPVQQRIRSTLAPWIDMDPESLTWGVDGCGVPTPRLSVAEMAQAYARFGGSKESDARMIASAMTKHPNMISGAEALSASIMNVTGGRLLAKEGAEGVFCLTKPGEAWGAAFKVADGASRAVDPAVVHTLAGLGLLTDEERSRLAHFERVAVANTRQEPVAALGIAST
jgi:L-asparaginase II